MLSEAYSVSFLFCETKLLLLNMIFFATEPIHEMPFAFHRQHRWIFHDNCLHQTHRLLYAWVKS